MLSFFLIVECRNWKACRALSDKKKKIQYCYRCCQYFLYVKNNELLLVFKTNFPKVQILLRITEPNQIVGQSLIEDLIMTKYLLRLSTSAALGQ
jgi:hypothetical protein